MKKTILATLLTLSSAAVMAAQPDNAANSPQAGFQDPNQPVAAQKQDIRQGKQQDRKDRREQNADRREQRHPHHYQAQACHGNMRSAMTMMGERQLSGFTQSKQSTTVGDANNWQDDQLIVLEGKIVKQVGKNDFLFKDNSGEIVLEIDRQAWKGLVTPEDTVRVIADVEKSWGKTEVEAHHVFKAKDTKAATSNAEQAPKAAENPTAPVPQP